MTNMPIFDSNIKLYRLLLSILGVLFLLGSVWLVRNQLELWPSFIILAIIKTVWILMILIVAMPISIAMILLPLAESSFVKSVVQKLIWPLEQFVKFGNYLVFGIAPFITYLFIFGVTYMFVVLLIEIKFPIISTNAALYLSLVITSMVFIYTGKNVAGMILRWYNKEWNFDKLLQFLTPNQVRVYVYGLMAIAYVISNLEKFSGTSILPFSWWISYKDIVVEMLLTIGVFDALLVIWKDRKSL